MTHQTAKQIWERIQEHDRMTFARAIERREMVKEWKAAFAGEIGEYPDVGEG